MCRMETEQRDTRRFGGLMIKEMKSSGHSSNLLNEAEGKFENEGTFYRRSFFVQLIILTKEVHN